MARRGDSEADYQDQVRQNVMDGLNPDNASVGTGQGTTPRSPYENWAPPPPAGQGAPPGFTQTGPGQWTNPNWDPSTGTVTGPVGGQTGPGPGDQIGDVIRPGGGIPWLQQQPSTPPPPSTGTTPPSAGAPSPPATGSPAPSAGTALTAPTVGRTTAAGSAFTGMPPELQDLFNSLRSGFASFQGPQINYQNQAPPAYNEALRGAIMNALQEGQRPVDENDPLVAPMLQSLRGQAQRQQEQGRQDLAEQLSAQHLLSSGALQSGVERQAQGINENVMNTQARLMTQVLSDRRNRLMQALQIGGNYLNADQARQLQAELANVNSAMSAYGVRANVGLNLLEQLMRNQQVYDEMGLRAGQFQAGLNQGAVTPFL